MPTDLTQFGLGDPNGSTGTLDTQSGTFTPGGDIAATQGSRLNPYIDALPWGQVYVGGVVVPGVVQSIDGHEKPEEWSVQKATKKSHASTVWKGTKLAESIKIVTALYNAESFAFYYDLQAALRPSLGEKPPSHAIVNPAVNFVGITRVAVVNVGPPKWVAGGGYWTGEITLIEYNPEKDANTGPAGAAKKPSGPDPNSDVKAELQKALDAAKAA